MPATTRSANKQAKLEDVGAGNPQYNSAGRKRRAEDVSKGSVATSSKKPKQSKGNNRDGPGDSQDENGSEDAIIINRAPVLELWASCVAQFLHPSVSWATCLSVGGAIATITAISKGRSIGKIDRPEPGEAQKKREERKKKAEKEDLDEIEVMSFKLNLKDGQATVGGKPKKAGEEALIKKYGGSEPYEKVKKTFQNCLREWKGQEEELDSRAFHAYEDFRPNIKPGQQGWGRKGELSLQTIKNAVSRT